MDLSKRGRHCSTDFHLFRNVSLFLDPSGILLIFSAAESSTLRLLAAAGASALYTDLSRVTGAIFVVHTLCCLTFNAAGRRSISHLIRIRTFFLLCKAVAASIRRLPGAVSSHYDLIQITVEILVMGTSLHRTS